MPTDTMSPVRVARPLSPLELAQPLCLNPEVDEDGRADVAEVAAIAVLRFAGTLIDRATAQEIANAVHAAVRSHTA